MIRLFSKMRYQLASQNQVAKYLRYAFGEILLVVIGILIALQVNNWNNDRKDRIQEKKFLSRLSADLETDLQNISSAIFHNNDRMQRARFLLETIDHPQLAEDSSNYFIQSIEYAGYTNLPVISDHTFEEIISSGKLSLIRNEDIRREVQKYYSWTFNRAQYNFIREDTQLAYLHSRIGILSPDQQISMGSFRNRTHFSPTEARQAYTRMLNKPDFLNLLPAVIQGQLRSSETFEDIRGLATDLKKRIETELNM